MKLAKNKTLLNLFKEESKDASIKRTEALRKALYRTEHSELRLAWQLAENELEAERSVLKGLTGNQVSTEVRMKLIEQDKRAASRAV